MEYFRMSTNKKAPTAYAERTHIGIPQSEQLASIWGQNHLSFIIVRLIAGLLAFISSHSISDCNLTR